MFGNLLKKNNAYLFQRILTNVQGFNFNHKICSPVIVSGINRCAYSNFVIPKNYKQNFWSQNYVRYKTTTETKENIKKENSTSDINTEILGAAPPTRAEKLRKAVKEYGSTVIVFHVGISLISLGSCYLLVTSGLDVNKIIVMIGLDNWLKSEVATSASTFAVAYAIHKVFAPARIAITLTSVPFIVRYLRRIGFLKK